MSTIEERAAELAAEAIVKNFMNDPQHQRVIRIKFYEAVEKATTSLVKDSLADTRKEILDSLKSKRATWEAEAKAELSLFLKNHTQIESIMNRLRQIANTFPQEQVERTFYKVVREQLLNLEKPLKIELNLSEIVDDAATARELSNRDRW